MKNTIYIRTSTEEQNPENQLKDCEAMAMKLGLDCETITDKQSAWNDKKQREGFNKLLEAIKKGEVKTLVVWDFDRLYRNRKRFKEFLELLKAYKVKLHSFRQEWFEDLYKIPEPWNEIVTDLMINIYGHIGQEESEKKSQRVKISIRKEDGITKSYKGNKWGRKNISEQTKQSIITAYNENKSYSQICSSVFYWDKNGNKKFVSKGVVHKTITNYKQEKALLSNGQ